MFSMIAFFKNCARSQQLIRPLLAIAAVLVLGMPAFGQRVTEDGKGGTARRRNEQARSTEGPVFRLGSLVGLAARTSDNQQLGKVTDLLLDLDEGRVSLVVVDGSGKPGTPFSGKFVLPADMFRDFANSREPTLSVAAADVQPGAMAKLPDGGLNRKWLGGVYEHFGRKPYWATDREASDNDVLIAASSLHDKAVRNDQGTMLGRIADFAATNSGEIAYAGLARADNAERLYPIPLSAFVVVGVDKDWILELPKDILENTPTFPSGAWPTTMDRGWIEYVSVRYGRSAFSGVERQPKETKAETSGK